MFPQAVAAVRLSELDISSGKTNGYGGTEHEILPEKSKEPRDALARHLVNRERTPAVPALGLFGARINSASAGNCSRNPAAARQVGL